MTVPLDTRQDIRVMDALGVPRAQIARSLGVSRNTVAKYADMEDMSPAAPVPRERPLTAVGPHAAWIDSVLEADLGAPRKQRHTARRVYDRLVAERGYSGFYSAVCRYVSAWRRGRQAAPGGFLELEWAPGTAQVDFGNFRCVFAGGPHRHEAAGRHAAPLQRPLLRRDAQRAVRVPVRRARPDLRVGGPGARHARARQRRLGGQDGPRQGDGVPALLAVQGPLPLSEPLLQPLLRQREGLRRERRGLPAPQPARPGAVRPVAGGTQPCPEGRLRPHQRLGQVPLRGADGRGAARGPRRHAGAARRPLRRREVGQRPRRQARLRRGRRQQVLRRPLLALQGPARRPEGRLGRDTRRPRQEGRRAPARGAPARRCATRCRSCRRSSPSRGRSASRRYDATCPPHSSTPSTGAARRSAGGR